MSISPAEQGRLAEASREERIAAMREYYARLHEHGENLRAWQVKATQIAHSAVTASPEMTAAMVEDFLQAVVGKDRRDAFRCWLEDGAPNPWEWEYREC